MRTLRFACRHSVFTSLSLLAIPLLLWPGRVHASDDFAAPALRIDLLTQQQSTTPAETTKPAPPEAWVEKVRARIEPGELLRVTGNFGRFSGRVASIDEQGLYGLQQDLRFDSTLPLPSEPLAWAEISRIERRGTSAGRFALYGGVGLGLVIGLGAMAAIDDNAGGSPYGYPPSTSGERFLAGAAVGGVLGAVVGAIVGRAVPRWNRVHP